MIFFLLLPKTLWRPQETVVNVKQHFMAGRWAKNISCFPESGPSVGASADLWSCFVPWNWMFDRKIWLVMHLNGLCHSLACRHLTFSFFQIVLLQMLFRYSLLLLLCFPPLVARMCSSCWKAECNSYFSSHIAPSLSPRPDQSDGEITQSIK